MLALEALRETEPLRGLSVARSGLEDDFAGFAIADLDGVHDAGAGSRRRPPGDRPAEIQAGEIDVEQRFRGGEFEDLAVLVEAVEAALAQLEEAGSQLIGRVDPGSALPPGGTPSRQPRTPALGRIFFARAFPRGLRSLPCVCSGNSTFSRVPSPSARTRIGHFVDRVLLDFLAALQAVRPADAGEQQPKIVVDLRRRAHCRSRIAGGVLLPDGYRRGDAVNDVDVRLLDALQKLPRIGRQRLHIAPLALGINGVEGKRRLAGAGHAGDHRQCCAGFQSPCS